MSNWLMNFIQTNSMMIKINKILSLFKKDKMKNNPKNHKTKKTTFQTFNKKLFFNKK